MSILYYDEITHIAFSLFVDDYDVDRRPPLEAGQGGVAFDKCANLDIIELMHDHLSNFTYLPVDDGPLDAGLYFGVTYMPFQGTSDLEAIQHAEAQLQMERVLLDLSLTDYQIRYVLRELILALRRGNMVYIRPDLFAGCE